MGRLEGRELRLEGGELRLELESGDGRFGG